MFGWFRNKEREEELRKLRIKVEYQARWIEWAERKKGLTKAEFNDSVHLKSVMRKMQNLLNDLPDIHKQYFGKGSK